MSTKLYAGIGSRRTPDDILEVMTALATKLSQNGWILRSGGARGADKAFERGAVGKAAIYTPSLKSLDDSTALSLAEQYHPNWGACNNYAKACHVRNGYIMFGPSLKYPVRFVICWTPGGKVQGGTGQALRLAQAFEIPIFNLASPYDLSRCNDFLHKGDPLI